MDPLSRRSRFALRAAIAATAAHAASFGHPDERPQGAVNANGGIRELHWHQAVTPPECTEARFFLCLAGLGISYFPFIIPPSDTIWQAAEPASSQGFLLIGAVIMIPIILTYMAYSNWTFAGKFEPGAHITDRNHHERASSPCLVGR